MHKALLNRSRLLLCILFSFCLIGCMVGPDFQKPGPPPVTRYTAKPLPKRTTPTPNTGEAGKSQQLILRKDIPVQWWRIFHSPELNQLINMALAHNQNLSAAYATLRSSSALLNAQIGTLYPAFNLVGTGLRNRASDLGSGLGGSSVFNIFNVSAQVTYVLDVWGGQRRQIENLKAQVDFQQFELIAAYLTLTTNVVTTAITVASLDEQIRVNRLLAKAQNQQLIILKKQLALGGIAEDTVMTQATLVNQTYAAITVLEKNAAITRHALAVLIGAYSDTPLPKINLDKLKLPEKIPLSIPSALVRQRPDIRASEALLHAASANIGVATANMLPSITLSGSFGYESTRPSGLFNTANKVWALSTNITQPLFHGGTLWFNRQATIAQFEQACAQYKQTVLQAFQNVADVLRSIEYDAKNLKFNNAALEAARRSYLLISDQYRLGGTSYLALLIAQTAYQTQETVTVQAKAAKFNDTAALFQALGGGWWNTKWCIDECL